jgi:hypothetical protein
MSLPPIIPVKLSSEEAGAIAVTPVVVQHLKTSELIEHMLEITGKDETRLREILRRGTLVIGGSRFRWAAWDPGAEGLHELLAKFPDPDPTRPFSADRCVRAILHGAGKPVELPRERAVRKRLFARRSFWDLLMEVTSAKPASYAGYSYRDRADRYIREFEAGEAERLRTVGRWISSRALRSQLRWSPFSQAELHATRPNLEAAVD